MLENEASAGIRSSGLCTPGGTVYSDCAALGGIFVCIFKLHLHEYLETNIDFDQKRGGDLLSGPAAACREPTGLG